MSVTYEAGSTPPTNTDLTNLMAQTVGNSKPNDLKVIMFALQKKFGTEAAVAVQGAVNTYLP